MTTNSSTHKILSNFGHCDNEYWKGKKSMSRTRMDHPVFLSKFIKIRFLMIGIGPMWVTLIFSNQSFTPCKKMGTYSITIGIGLEHGKVKKTILILIPAKAAISFISIL